MLVTHKGWGRWAGAGAILLVSALLHACGGTVMGGATTSSSSGGGTGGTSSSSTSGSMGGATSSSTSGSMGGATSSSTSGSMGGATSSSSSTSGGGGDGGVVAMNVCQASSGTVAWTTSIPLPAGMNNLMKLALAAGPTDDVVVGDGILGSSTWIFELRRYDASGNPISLHQEGNPDGFLSSTNLVMDAQNNVGCGFATTGQEVAFMKADPSGAALYASKVFLTSPYAEQIQFRSAAGDAAGNLYVSFDAFPVPMHPWPWSAGAHTIQVSPNGAYAEATSPTPSSYGVVEVTGPSLGGCASAPLAVPAEGAMEILRYDAASACAWGKLLAVPAAAYKAVDVATGADGSLAIAVRYTGTIDLGSGPLTSAASGALALARFDASGTLLWARSFDGLSLPHIQLNPAGVLGLSSRYAGAVDLGAGPLPASGDTVLAVFDPAGQLRWNKAVTVGTHGTLDMAVSPCALVIATDSTSVDLGDGPLSAQQAPGPPPVNSIGVAALAL